MNVLPGVDLVGSGWLGFSLTDAHDCNVFLLHSRGEAVLIDAGCGLAGQQIVDHIRAAGVEPSSVSRVLLTHSHADHAAGAGELARLLGAEVVASAHTGDVVVRGDEVASGLASARVAGVYTEAVRFSEASAVRPIDDAPISVGDIKIRAISTPGHAAGHLCYLAELDGTTALFSGDLVFTRGRVAILATPDTDVGELAASIRRVAALEPDALLPGHGTFALDKASAHLDAAITAFAMHQLPDGLL